MSGQLQARWGLALIGAFGGVLLWAVIKAEMREMIGDRAAMVLIALIVPFFAAVLAMAGPVGLRRALPGALGLALVVAALTWVASLRYAEVYQFAGPLPALALFTVAALPVPFLIAAARSHWRDYPALFLEGWSIVVRYAAAWAFVGVVWLVIYLSDQVLQIVGIEVIATLLQREVVPMVITGAVLGLAMAVVYELAELLSPYLVLRLVRLLLPVVLLVMVIFLVALPFRGLDALFSGLSPSLLLLTMVAAGVSLVSVAVDQTDEEATQSPVLRRAAQGMALALPVVAGLAVWAIWQRVAQHGWTPERIFVVLMAGLALVYGGVYAAAVLRGAGWMGRIRRGNIHMALAVIVLAALWLTPVLNAERISAQSQLSRFEAGRTAVADLDLLALGRWGVAGTEVLTALEAKAKEPGQEALAERLAGGGTDAPSESERAEAVAALAAILPVQPATATGTRDSLLSLAEDYTIEDWRSACARVVEGGGPACLMVVVDLLPSQPGEEAMIFLDRSADYVEVQGLYVDGQGMLIQRSPVRPDGRYVSVEEARALLRDYAVTPPPLTPAMLNQIGTGETGLMILP